MGSCCGGGTPIEKFILGKEKYIEDRIPNQTVYKAQMDIQRDQTGDKPAYVDDSTFPSLGFLRQEIADGEDVELFLDQGDDSHLVTLVSIGPQEDGVGDLNWVDPLTGKTLPYGASYHVIKDGFTRRLQVEYHNPVSGAFIAANISADVSESPVPEPATWTFMVTGIAVLVLRRKWTVRRG